MRVLKSKRLTVPYSQQKNSYYCGPASLQMVFNYFNFYQSQKEIAIKAKTNADEGTSHQKMIETATSHGFYCYVNNRSTFFEIRHFLERELPVTVNFIEPSNEEGHYAVVSGITRSKIILHDPWNGKNFKMSRKEFLERWQDEKNQNKEWIMVIAQDDFHLGKQYLPKK